MDSGRGSGFLGSGTKQLAGSNEPDGSGSSSSDESAIGRLGDQVRLDFVTDMVDGPTGVGTFISISISSPDSEESESELTSILEVGSSSFVVASRAFDVSPGSK